MTIIQSRVTALAAFVLLAGCQAVPRPAAPPPPPPPAPTPTPTPAPQPTLSWDVAPVLPGDWSYGVRSNLPTATFGPDAATPQVTFACRPATRQIELTAHAVQPTARNMVIRTSFGALPWPGAITPGGGAPMLRVTRPASDPGFDWIAYSRGRIAIEIDGGTRLVVPVWAEISRVIEDCRN
jgi:hypothetical protein